MAAQPIGERELGWLIRDKYPDLFVSPRWRTKFRALQKDVARLRKGEPLAYVIGWTPFLDTRIDLREGTLIPRTETEFWTETAIKELRAACGNRPFRCLDLFSGSGCIGIAVLKAFPRVRMTFADLDARALRQIRRNVKLNGQTKRRAQILRSDVFAGVQGKFDVIFANPPYIPSGRTLPVEVSDFEPMRALKSGTDGLRVIRKFIQGVAQRLLPGGRAYLEIDRSQGRAISSLASKHGLSVRIRKDQFGRTRWAELRPQERVAE